MPDSPGKKTICLLPNRPDTKALNMLLRSVSSTMIKSPKTPSTKLLNPTAQKFQDHSSQQLISGWLSKESITSLKTTDKHTEGIKNGQKRKTAIQKSLKPLSVVQTKKKGTSTLPSKESSNASKTSKKSSKPTFCKSNSGSSDELPIFKEKSLRKRPKHTETFKKYGVVVPSLDEIVADQKKFTNYKNQVEEAQTLKEPTFKMPISTLKSNQSENRVLLDCKQLTLEEIAKYFNTNIPFLLDIINGKKCSDRHRRYFDKKNKQNDLTTKDLTYNTSTIVFTFEQIDHMISLMQTEFDPEDKKTGYFFKVLVPELCLKIFMKIHNMNKREANAYLENRPVE